MTKIQKAAAAAIVLGGLVAGTAVTVHAHRQSCNDYIEKAEKRLSNAIEKYGDASQEARFRRHELEEAREHCEEDHWYDRDNRHRRHHRHHDHDRDHDHDHDHDDRYDYDED